MERRRLLMPLAWLAVAALVIFVAMVISDVVVKSRESTNRYQRFKGACQVDGGKVHDDVCIKNNRVILRAKEVK